MPNLSKAAGALVRVPTTVRRAIGRWAGVLPLVLLGGCGEASFCVFGESVDNDVRAITLATERAAATPGLRDRLGFETPEALLDHLDQSRDCCTARQGGGLGAQFWSVTLNAEGPAGRATYFALIDTCGRFQTEAY